MLPHVLQSDEVYSLRSYLMKYYDDIADTYR